MTYQPYLSGGGVGNQLPMAQPPPQPPSLRNAVRLMWVGAGVALLGAITAVKQSSKIKTEIFDRVHGNNHQGRVGYTIAQQHTITNITFVALVVAGLISVLLWMWMAWANNRASGWARICASVFFVLITVEAAISPGEASVPAVSIVFIVLQWLLGLVAVVLLWRRATTAYIGAG
jgi:hypothetical protein